MRKHVGKVLGLLLLACCAASPTSAPSDPLVDAASQAVASGTLREFSSTLDSQIRPLLDSLNQVDADKLIRLASFREFGRYFSRIKTLDSDQTETLQWLITKPALLSTLMMSVSQADAPDRVLDILSSLRADQKDRLEDFPDLTAAMCVVWDSPEQRPSEADKPDPSRPRSLMRYYINAGQRFRNDLSRFPWQLAIYVIDNRVSDDEIVWALNQYAGRSTIGAVYFDVPYDYNTFFGTGMPRDQQQPHAYTLQNIRQYGGICADQAYFATQVARSVGIPATVAAGRGGAADGVAHAWVGYLDVRAGRPEWNFEEGRYPEYQFWKGRIIDPQTREPINEADVSLLAELLSVSPKNRLVSAALFKVAELRESSERATIYMHAINLSPGNRAAWLALADMGAKLKLGDQQFTDLKSVVAKFAAKKYPDFAFTVLSRAISGRGTLQQLAELDQMGQLFAGLSRADLMTEVSLAEAELYLKDQHPEQTMAIYGDLLDRNASAGTIVMEVMEHVEQLLVDLRDLQRLRAIYEFAWRRMPTPEPSAYVRTTPFYIIGERYERLLKETSDFGTAQNVQARLDSLTAASSGTATPRRK